MKILIISDNPFIPELGGIERVTDVLTKELITRYEHNIYYLSVGKESDIIIYENKLPVPLFIINYTLSLVEKREHLSRLIQKYNIDVIINQRGQLPHFYDLVCGLNVRVVNVIHSQPLAYVYLSLLSILKKPYTYLGYLKYILKILIYPMIYIKREHALKTSTASYYSKLLASSDALVLLSEKYCDELRDYLKLEVSSNCKLLGIANPNTYRSYPKLLKKKKTILYVGRLCSDEKNPIRLLKIWRRLYSKNPDWDIKFVGEGGALKTMLKYVELHNIPRVSFCGSQIHVQDYYRDAAFICLTSNIEGWGMTLTEGMQWGCIPITFNSYAAAADIIDDGINGCLITPFNLREYATRLSELMKDENKRYVMSLAAQAKSRKFDVSNICVKWQALLTELTL